MSNTSYRHDFIVNEYVEAHNWYTDEYRLLKNPNNAKERGELQNRFIKKFKSLWEVSIASHKNKKRNTVHWVQIFCNGNHRFQQNYTQIEKNLETLKRFRKNWLEKTINKFDTLMHKFRTICDRKAPKEVTFPPKSLSDEINKLFKKNLKQNSGYRSARARLIKGVHHYLSEEGQQEHQEWLLARHKRNENYIVDSLKYLCEHATINFRSTQFREKFGFSNNVGDGIYFSYKPNTATDGLAADYRNDPEIKKWIKVWSRKMKQLKAKPDITDDVINLAKKWFENHAPWWIEAHSNNAGKKTINRNIFIKAELKKKYGFEVTDGDIGAILFPLRWHKIKKIKRVKLFTEYDMNVTEEKQQKMIDYGLARRDKINKKLRQLKKIYASPVKTTKAYMKKVSGGMGYIHMMEKFRNIK